MTGRASTLLAGIPNELYIGGEWLSGENGTIDVLNPATDELIATIANGSAA